MNDEERQQQQQAAFAEMEQKYAQLAGSMLALHGANYGLSLANHLLGNIGSITDEVIDRQPPATRDALSKIRSIARAGYQAMQTQAQCLTSPLVAPSNGEVLAFNRRDPRKG